jgi:hypothetical protein
MYSLSGPSARLLVLVVAVFISMEPLAQESTQTPARLWPGMGEVHHPVSTNDLGLLGLHGQVYPFVRCG